MGNTFSNLLPVISTDFGIQFAAYAIAAPLQTDRFYDFTGSMTYLVCVLASLANSRLKEYSIPSILQLLKDLHPRQLLVSATTILWCVRLGSYLLYRISKHGKDSRFDKIKVNPVRFFVAWFLQGVWVYLTAFPVYVVNVTPATDLAPIGLLDYIGFGMWLVGFGFETIADYQKIKWQNKLGNDRHKTFIADGLWSVSRHPNYFGEMLLWAGNAVTCSSAFTHLGVVGLRTAIIFAVSPVFVYQLINNVSGVNLLEKASDKKFKDVKEYLAYKKSVPILVPRLFPKLKKD
ncbi:hypothetical protein HDV06_000026 [Boothiomyces sp. JEL0866]|nr:hypothetical protein HDV06_000026 [Boothiomyces sp. JEL0866]